ncbi:hypothetical protein ACX27_26715 [Nostoc piscinale CENA21]|uniref:Uncharacterized protein n=1 Tax=Nostoc piscinale CENA21 TaxID=224013 RepID=A0A0M4T0Q3_9NOSO|nr:hypothetical protein [Nostoc piscinale]ALF55621.1 hypothetical protein ACX27_26715 [Nostoc piscinale CENA21]
MVRKVTTVEEPKQVIEAPKTFAVQYDDEAGTVSFNLSDGTPVEMRKPRTRQLLLIDSWKSTADPEYVTTAFTALKLASLCVTKFGNANKVSFDELIDVDFEDCERVVKALECFRDVFDSLQARLNSQGAVTASNDT